MYCIMWKCEPIAIHFIFYTDTPCLQQPVACQKSAWSRQHKAVDSIDSSEDVSVIQNSKSKRQAGKKTGQLIIVHCVP